MNSKTRSLAGSSPSRGAARPRGHSLRSMAALEPLSSPKQGDRWRSDATRPVSDRL